MRKFGEHMDKGHFSIIAYTQLCVLQNRYFGSIRDKILYIGNVSTEGISNGEKQLWEKLI